MLNILLAVILGGSAHAGDTPAAKPKSQFNSNLYEQEDKPNTDKSFSAKVRIVRDISDDIEVMFEGDSVKGIYSLSRNRSNFAAMLKALEASKKTDGGAVTVTADEDKNIKTVEAAKNTGRTFVPPTDPNKKWDFGKLAE